LELASTLKRNHNVGNEHAFSCTGKITRAELAKLPTPPATATHIPIPHAAVVETLVETLSHRQIGVVGEEFAVSKDDMVMFGVLDLETSFEGCGFAIEIRNADAIVLNLLTELSSVPNRFSKIVHRHSQAGLQINFRFPTQ
jgi:hypothetical protein